MSKTTKSTPKKSTKATPKATKARKVTTFDAGGGIGVDVVENVATPAPEANPAPANAPEANDAANAANVAPPVAPAAPAEPQATETGNAPEAAPAEPKAKKTKAPKPETPRKPSGLDAAAQVLKDKGEPMTCKAIVETMLAKGMWTTNGKTPAATIYSAMLREIDGRPGDSRFVKAGRGLFALTTPATPATPAE